MGLHPNAALTIRQRQELQRLRHNEGWTITRLASHFHVNRRTVFRWVQRTSADDRSPPSITHGRRIVTAAYQDAVIAYRHAHPTHGPQRIMDAVRDQFPTANTATMWRILHAAGLSQRVPKKSATADRFL